MMVRRSGPYCQGLRDRVEELKTQNEAIRLARHRDTLALETARDTYAKECADLRARNADLSRIIFSGLSSGEHENPGLELRESVESEVAQLIHILHPNISCYEASAALQNLDTWLKP